MRLLRGLALMIAVSLVLGMFVPSAAAERDSLLVVVYTQDTIYENGDTIYLDVRVYDKGVLVDADEVEAVARFIASVDPGIPYSLLAFHPDFLLTDLPMTSKEEAREALTRARKTGLSRLHIYCNTLQAIACGYLFAVMLLLYLSIFWQILATALLLMGYWAAMMLIPVPGHGAGVLEPDANLALYIDRLILGRFEDGLPYTWILSGMGFTATVMLGVFSGELLRSKQRP